VVRGLAVLRQGLAHDQGALLFGRLTRARGTDG
jgi:hypothetical protein